MNNSGLVQAGAWNYLREEITVALECRRPTRISIHLDFDPDLDYSDSNLANVVSYMLAKIINHCFGVSVRDGDSTPVQDAWQSLSHDLKVWRKTLPASFIPYSTAPKPGSPFPSIWSLQPCHGMSWQ